MADKEASVYIVDLGSSMADCHNGRTEPDLDWSMRYVWDKISTTVAASRKTWTVGFIGLKTDETRNAMMDDEGYENISVLRELGPMTLTSLRELRAEVKPSETETGDAVSAVVLAVDMIEKFTRTLKYKRRIYLVTDGLAPIDGDDIDSIAKKINQDGIELTVLGVDFDDAEYGFKEEDKPSIKKKNEGILQELVSKCDKGQFATIAEAIDELDTPRLKPTRPYKTYDGPLTLGLADPPADLKIPPTPVVINVERYFRTKQAKPPTASTVVVSAEGQGAASQSTQALEGEPMEGVESVSGFAAVRSARTYRVNDPDAPGGKRDVEFDSLAKGYEYGRTAVAISESEWNVTKLETVRTFSIIGFIPCEKYEPFLNMGETCMTVSRKFDEKSQLALSSLIHALYELESYAVARLVVKDKKDPVLVLLAPRIEPDMECLYDVPLPFAEDVRGYQFPPLDRVVTVSGQEITENHRLLPGDDLTAAMSDYVDSMDLGTFGADEDGNPSEYAAIDDTYNPMIHRINQAIRQRAVDPQGTIEPVPPILVRYAAPPEELVEQSSSQIKTLVSAAQVKKVPPKAKGKRKHEASKPLSGLDVDALLGTQPKRPKISVENAIPEFKRALAVADEVETIVDAATQMGDIVARLVADSFGDANYARALENLTVLRGGLVDLDEPAVYNDIVRGLKGKILSGELGGDRREMWWKIRMSRLGLVDQATSEVSDVTSEQADEFLKSK
ncbi:ATP-dependent DNA helicase II subunit 2 [Colletotrichum higginsianum IMI 349063]|uniref:ATP-dependent DNA helicase II subunit 2 n=2 Tax=Colletotrichum higginsianum TaxID=80884 RepID=A0A1B7YQ72_COLHI|nr:ATP-dependent DNA helicase II subunit 2 [Colletotrichum higginsianum IMI 349063]OBR14163.1 ATP-dependent DNA helicase II subunit 2 [Colletotrichum higginsianum IMI 349063]TID01491.1 ATP-dependent DNA helicase II subunit 2 [Colletotrichum higginsianum]